MITILNFQHLACFLLFINCMLSVAKGQDKPGFCPPFYGQPSLTSLDRCRGDVQCPGDRKCCQTLNGRVCLKPQTTAVHHRKR
ncbi:Antileukoproteinase -like protein [Trichinella sp. T9]|nr:Antileukoproteinase -like protein [Trichinella sp. T9]